MSSDKKVTYTNPFADVDMTPINVGGREVSSKIAVRVKDDSGEYQVMGILSKDYQLLSNRKVRDYAEDIMSRTGQEYGGYRNLKTLFDGKRYVDFFASNNPIVSIQNGKELPLHLGLACWNSYDGTRASGFECFALNPFCTNQYHSRTRFGFFAWRHTGADNRQLDVDDALSSLAIGAQNVTAIAPAIKLLKAAPITAEAITTAHAKTEMPTSKWGEVLAQLAKEEASLFGLYQALTFVASHSLNGLTAISIGSTITDHLLPMQEQAKPAQSHTTAATYLAHNGA